MKVKIKNLKELKEKFNGVNDNPPYHYYTHEEIINNLKDKIQKLYDKQGKISISYTVCYGTHKGEPIDRDCQFLLEKYNEEKNKLTYSYIGIIG